MLKKLFTIFSIVLLTSLCYAKDVTITIIYNNVPYDENLQIGWGFSAFIDGTEKNILFDTGGNGPLLLSNMEKLGIDPGNIDIILLSHIHGDHTGGLDSILERNPECTVYLPQAFPAQFKEATSAKCREVISVNAPAAVCEGVWSTGQLGTWIKEQSLVIDSKEGLIVITGCAHPGILNIAKHAKEYFNKDIYLLIGGFHLEYTPSIKVKNIIKELKKTGVRKVAPSHCTGRGATELFRQAWGKDFMDLSCGASLKIERKPL